MVNSVCNGNCSPVMRPLLFCNRQYRKLAEIPKLLNNLEFLEFAKRIAACACISLGYLIVLAVGLIGKISRKVSNKNSQCASCQNIGSKSTPKGVLKPALSVPVPKGQKHLSILFTDEQSFSTEAFSYSTSVANVPSFGGDFSTLTPTSTFKEIIDLSLKNSRGFCLRATNPHHAMPNRFLIENMDYLKSQGVKVLFLEGLEYEQQDSLNRFFENKLSSREMDDLFKQFPGYPDEKNTLYDVVKAAKKAEIRVVGFNYNHQLEEANNPVSRSAKLIYMAALLYDFEMSHLLKKDKFVLFFQHDNLYKTQARAGLPNIAAILECPSIQITDKSVGTDYTVFGENQDQWKLQDKLHIDIYS